MGNSFKRINPVLKSGGTMTGKLVVRDTTIRFENGTYAGELRASENSDNRIAARNNGNTSSGAIQGGSTIVNPWGIALGPGDIVDGVDISATKTAHMKTGYYTGNGTDNRNIDIGVDLSSMDFVWVIVKATDAAAGVGRTDYMISGNSHYFNGTADATDKIQSLTSTGFQVGLGGEVNTNTQNYTYIAFWKTTLS